MTGTTWIEESGLLEGPVAITNTHSVGVVRDAILAVAGRRGPDLQPWGLPVVAETYDGGLNDINGFHVKPEHVFAALDGATGRRGRRGERRRRHRDGLPRVQGRHRHRVAAARRRRGRLHGRRARAVQLRRAPRAARRRRAGRRGDPGPAARASRRRSPRPASRRAATPRRAAARAPSDATREHGLDHRRRRDRRAAAAAPAQARRHARRRSASAAWAGCGGNSSGDIFLAFSTANPGARRDTDVARVEMLPNARINPLFTRRCRRPRRRSSTRCSRPRR